VVRAFLIDRLVNELHYKPENLETEKEYTIKGGHSKINPRVDVLVKDEKGNPFFLLKLKHLTSLKRINPKLKGSFLLLHKPKSVISKPKYAIWFITPPKCERMT
jgi:type I restriction enzyme M protein